MANRSEIFLLGWFYVHNIATLERKARVVILVMLWKKVDIEFNIFANPYKCRLIKESIITCKCKYLIWMFYDFYREFSI